MRASAHHGIRAIQLGVLMVAGCSGSTPATPNESASSAGSSGVGTAGTGSGWMTAGSPGSAGSGTNPAMAGTTGTNLPSDHGGTGSSGGSAQPESGGTTATGGTGSVEAGAGAGAGGAVIAIGGKPIGKVWNTALPSSMVGVPKSSWQMDLISPTMNNKHHVNQAMIVNGYLLVGGNEEFWFYDVSNPKEPKVVGSVFSPPTAHVSKEAESHCLTAMRSGENFYVATTSGTGADLWDATIPSSVKWLSHVTTPNTSYGDYTEAVWGLSWVGQYLYLGATNNGISVVDTSSLTAPKIVTQIANSSFGGVNAGPVDVIGNVLVAMTPKNNSGIATIDVSDPLKPSKLSAFTTKTNSYITQFYRHYAFEIGPLRVWDVLTDPKNVSTMPVHEESNEYAEYLSFADDALFLGHARTSIGTAPGATKYDISNITAGKWPQLDRIWGRLDDGGINDDQFTLPFGNLLYIGDDQEPYYGWVIGVHQAEPDTKAPIIDTVIPRDKTSGVSLKTAIGVSLTDNIELASVTQQSFIVRPVGGNALPGRYGVRMGVINFDPEGDLQPGTTYEVVLPAGGVTDYVGNPLASEWKTTFTTTN